MIAAEVEVEFTMQWQQGPFPVASECVEMVVGQTYLVPCIEGVPVIGDPHTDADHFNDTPEHYHVDSRFYVGFDSEFKAVFTSRVPAGTVPTLHLMKCVAPEVKDWAIESRLAAATMSLYLDYGGAKLKCGTCVHKGMPVINGICTGHRLKWLPDGSCRHKPPFTLRIRGSQNEITLKKSEDLEKIRIPIVENVTAGWIDMHDRDGSVIASRNMGLMPYQAGDTLTINFSGRNP